MSTLVLARHGQARAFDPDPDRLSETGEAQARALARWWIEHGISFDEVYTGALNRQIETEKAVRTMFHEAGRAWPDARTTPDLNEYDARRLVEECGPACAGAEFETFRTQPDNRNFQKLLEAVMDAWFAGRAAHNGIETWPAFRDRVRGALARIREGPGNRRIVVFTSGGPIGLAVQSAIGAPEEAFMHIHWRVRNASLTEFVFSGSRISLDSFNATPHLGPGLVTFR